MGVAEVVFGILRRGPAYAQRQPLAAGIGHTHVAVGIGGGGLVQRHAATQGDRIAQLEISTQRNEGGVAIAEFQH
ncbi:hypothetical protein D3C73_1379800 [compost metagenome]